ncbi:MAG: hypothetical protein U0Y08_06520 [Bacteroidia bacterium]
MYSILPIWLLGVVSNQCHAQFNNDYWLFGDSVGINWMNSSGPSLFKSKLKGRGTSVSLSDSSGVLIYSGTGQNSTVNDRTETYNKYNLEIPNSDSICGEGWYHEMLLIPDPVNDSLVFLITIGVNIWDGLYYTIINYRANNDSGMVIQKNVQLQNVPAFDGLTAVQHGNGRDWWVLFKKWDGTGQVGNNITYKYLVNANGINLYSYQSIGPINSTNLGQLIFNLNSSKLVAVNLRGLISIYDFDRCTGQLSQPITIEAERSGPPYPYYISAAFSPDDSKLYIMSVSPANLPGESDTLFQFDLNAPNIAASKQVIYVYPTYESGMGNMKLAPDNKIYITAADEIASIPYPDSLFTTINNNLSVINYPDSLGIACDFQPFSFNLGTGRTYFGLPNNPDYELGAWVGSPCDTLTVGLNPGLSPEERGAWIQAWYNHEWNMIHVNAAQLKGRKGMLRLFDIEGRIVFEKPAEVLAGGYYTTEIYMNEISEGVYVVNLVTDRETLSFKTMKY